MMSSATFTLGFMSCMTLSNQESFDVTYEATEEQCFGANSDIDSIVTNGNHYNSAMEIMNEMNNKMEIIETKEEFAIVIGKIINKLSNLEKDKIELILLLTSYNQEYNTRHNENENNIITSKERVTMELEEWEYENESNSQMDGIEREENEMSRKSDELQSEPSGIWERNNTSESSGSRDSEPWMQGWEKERDRSERSDTSESSDNDEYSYQLMENETMTRMKSSENVDRNEAGGNRYDTKKHGLPQLWYNSGNESYTQIDEMSRKSDLLENDTWSRNNDETERLHEKLSELGYENERLKKEMRNMQSHYENELLKSQEMLNEMKEKWDQLESKEREKLVETRWNEKGYLKCHNGDTIDNRYTIIDDLGQGGYGKVVKVFDKIEMQEKAMKISRKGKGYYQSLKREADILYDLTKKNGSVHGIGTMVNRIDCKSKGIHMMVMDLYGACLFDVIGANWNNGNPSPLPDYLIKDVTRQLFEAMSFLHENGFTYSDLKPENIVFVDDRYKETTLKKNGKKCTVPVNTQLKIIDFGCVFKKDDKKTKDAIQTEGFRAPEVILQLGWNEAIDLWSIGCVVLECKSGDTIFRSDYPPNGATCEDLDKIAHLNQMEILLNAMPNQLKNRVDASLYTQLFTKDGKLKLESAQIPKYHPKSLKHYFDKNDKEDMQLYDLVEKTLQWKPENRQTAMQLLSHPYFGKNT